MGYRLHFSSRKGVVELGTSRRLLRHAFRYWHVLAVTMISLAVATYLSILTPLFIKEIVDSVLMGKQYDRLVILSLAIVGVTVLRGVFNFIQRYTGEYVGQKVAFDLRNLLFACLQAKSFSFYDKAQTGQLMSRATGDVDTIRMFLAFGVEALISSLLMVGMILTVVVSMDVRLSLLSLLTIPIVFMLALRFSRQVRPLFNQVRDMMGSLNAVLQENLIGTKVVRAFAREEFEKEKFSRKNQAYLDLNVKAARLRSTFIPLMALSLNLVTVIIYWYGGSEVIGKTLSLGSLIAFNSYLTMLILPIRFFGFLIAFYQNAMAGANRVFEIIDARPEVIEKPGAVELPKVLGEVKLLDVYFGYDPGHSILKGLNLTVKPNETVAIVGGTGSGKTTLINLIPRFYDVTSGKVLIDGYYVRDVTLKSLRKQIGIVSQETFLFSTTIKENISYGKRDASMEEIVQAAKMAQIHDFVASLPDGYQTVVGERGVTLSGGQKQRVAIARALLMDPRILILDDSTSSVDVETEHEIQKAIKALLKDRTTLIITQRLSMIRNADRIVFLEDGRVVEEGKHEELMARVGAYARFYDAQLSPQGPLLAQPSKSSSDGGG